MLATYISHTHIYVYMYVSLRFLKCLECFCRLLIKFSQGLTTTREAAFSTTQARLFSDDDDDDDDKKGNSKQTQDDDRYASLSIYVFRLYCMYMGRRIRVCVCVCFIREVLFTVFLWYGSRGLGRVKNSVYNYTTARTRTTTTTTTFLILLLPLLLLLLPPRLL